MIEGRLGVAGELEDLNAFLSVCVLSEEKREAFVRGFVAALKDAGEKGD